jgi:2-keto-4-pentenoate hydratase/2-oxohepta-3-ene-1,7-dioic acid hydratase in catechol pathway
MVNITRYVTNEGPAYGWVENGRIYQLLGGNPLTTPIEELKKGDLVGAADHLLLYPPVDPTKIVCVGRNYAAHAAEHNAEVPKEPMLFLKPPSALIAYDMPIEIPPNIGRVDLEAELAVVIGKTARRVKKEQALHYVFGYMCANDVSARVLQKEDKQWGRAKGFDTFCPIGPWVTTDLDPSNLQISGRLNGQTVINSSTRYMIFDVPTLIEFISHVMTLEAGDIIVTGTPEGVSEIRENDIVEIEIEGIGVLRNSVENRGD